MPTKKNPKQNKQTKKQFVKVYIQSSITVIYSNVWSDKL